MAKRKTEFSFKARLAEVQEGLISTVIYIPTPLMKELPRSRVRVKGSMNGAPFALAVQYRKNAPSFFIVSKPLRKAAGANPGDFVLVKFHLVSDKVDLPAELEALLEQDSEGKKAWLKLTPGYQRSLCHYITSVKNVDSRISRALFLVNKAKQLAYKQESAMKEKK